MSPRLGDPKVGHLSWKTNTSLAPFECSTDDADRIDYTLNTHWQCLSIESLEKISFHLLYNFLLLMRSGKTCFQPAERARHVFLSECQLAHFEGATAYC